MLLPIPTFDKQIEKWDRDNAHTGPEKPSSFPALLLPAAVRLFPGSSNKALDPVGNGFLLFITTNRQKVAEKFERFQQFLSASQLYYRFCTGRAALNLAGVRALMPRTSFGLTTLKAASKLFFIASQPARQRRFRVFGPSRDEAVSKFVKTNSDACNDH